MDNYWIYNGERFTSDMIGIHIGFVYMITDMVNGKKYIGKKLLEFSVTTKRKIKTGPNAGNLRKIHKKKESDWETYYSSNEEIKSLAKENPGRYKREILHLCRSKSEASYLEAKLQFEHNVLYDDSYYNDIINCRVNGKALRARTVDK